MINSTYYLITINLEWKIHKNKIENLLDLAVFMLEVFITNKVIVINSQ